MSTRRKVVYKESGEDVKLLTEITLPEGVAVIREITEDWRVLVQFKDRMIVPNWRELNPEDIGAQVTLIAPPVGLRPRYIWVSQRIEEIREAIARYEAANKEVPRAWRAELSALSGSVFESVGTAKNLDDFASDVAYHPAYSVEDLEQMEIAVKPYLVNLHDRDFLVRDGQLVIRQPGGAEEIMVPKFESNKNYPYLIAFLLNNAYNFLRRK